MAVIQDLLAPSVVTRIVSRIYTPGSPLSQFFGVQIGGANVDRVVGRSYSYDILDNVRDISKGRAPGTGPATHALSPVGRQTWTFPRSYEKTALNYELLNNIRTLGKNAGERDRLGARYLEAQARQQKLRQEHFREFQIGALITQGKCSFQIDGDDWIPVLSLGANPGFTLDWGVPSASNGIQNGAFAANLNPTGGGNIIDAAWSTAGTNIPAHLDAISQAFHNLVGLPLALVITNSTVWNFVLNNTKLQAQGGSVNAVFTEYTVEQSFTVGADASESGAGKPKINVFVARLKARPWIRWVIVDTGLNINGTYTPWFPLTNCTATFMVEPDPYWLKGVEGSEPVKQNPMAPAVEQYGFHAWLREWDEPARVELHSLQNFLIEMAIPKAIMFGQVS